MNTKVAILGGWLDKSILFVYLNHVDSLFRSFDLWIVLNMYILIL